MSEDKPWKKERHPGMSDPNKKNDGVTVISKLTAHQKNVSKLDEMVGKVNELMDWKEIHEERLGDLAEEIKACLEILDDITGEYGGRV